eukprot:497691_1
MQSPSNSKPNIPSYIAIHNKSLYSDFVTSINYNHGNSFSNNTQPLQSTQNSKSSPNLHKMKLESKKKKILKYHSELEKWRANDLKRTLQRIEFKKNKDEAQFRKTLNMIESRGGIYGEVSDVLYKQKAQEFAKTANLYTNWHSKVYNPIDRQIKSASNDRQYMMHKKTKMRNLYDKYLAECNKNGNKIFLDSINTKEYDPFEWRQDDGAGNNPKIKIDDPLKSDLNKYINEQKISNKTTKYFNNNNNVKTVQSNSELVTNKTIKSNTFSLKPRTRYCISPAQYNQVSHLPLFRDIESLQRNKDKCILPSHVPGGNILLNQYQIPKYNAEIVRKQFFPQTKRIVKPAFSKYEFKISEMW